MTIIDLVISKQELEKENDTDFAKRLGISPSGWYYLKNKLRNPGMKFYSAVMRVYPDLAAEISTEIKEG